LSTPFPPVDRSMGYERGTSVSEGWERATTDAAIEVAGYVVGHLRELSAVPDTAADRAERLREFCRQFAERAFRRPLTEEQKRLYIDRPFAQAGDPELAVKRVVLFVLKSPRFLYREIGAAQSVAAADAETKPKEDSYDVAARIAFGLWDSLPDAELLQAAAKE